MVSLALGEHTGETVNVGIPILTVHEDVDQHVDAVLSPVQNVQHQETYWVHNIAVDDVDHHDWYTAHQHQDEDDEDGTSDTHVTPIGGQTLTNGRRLSGAESAEQLIIT